ncbi:MAG TPA: 50S ribosomal protein L18 [Gemmataceae bacterium]|jgi:large subunit ribosomal protein L18|nr:50S ribosomal protein L18 [Gemmataceae bacterium]
MAQQKRIQERRERRKFRVRNKVRGTSERPRLSVFRSSKHIYAQLIDDLSGQTLAAASSCGKDVAKEVPYGGNVKAAKAVGKKLADAAKAKGISKAAFDRGSYRYHGRVKALADAARESGLQF